MSQSECVFRALGGGGRWGEGSSQGETFEVRTIISIKQGHHCPLHPQVKPKITRRGDVNGSFFEQIKA